MMFMKSIDDAKESTISSSKSKFMFYGLPPTIDRAFYSRLAHAQSTKTPFKNHVVPIQSGKAWPVQAGQICRIMAIEGPQVADFNCWNLDNPREHFWQARTRQFCGSHVKIYDQLWSTLPYLRPMLTIINDTVAYGVDEDGARCHDLLGSRCDPYGHKLQIGKEFDYCCHSNLTRAILPFGLTEFDVHDVLNIFQITGIQNDRNFSKHCTIKKGDFFEFFAEIDLLCAISICPFGDFFAREPWVSDTGDILATCRPLGVEIYQPDAELLRGWESPRPSNYRGNHGLKD